jgi:hypothetical protein
VKALLEVVQLPLRIELRTPDGLLVVTAELADVGPPISEQSHPTLTGVERRILGVCSTDPKTAKWIAARLGRRRVDSYFRELLGKLVDRGFLVKDRRGGYRRSGPQPGRNL